MTESDTEFLARMALRAADPEDSFGNDEDDHRLLYMAQRYYDGDWEDDPLAQEPARAPRSGEETGWVIEHGRSQPSHPEYWQGEGAGMNTIKNTGPQPLRVRGVGRMADEPRSLLVCLTDIPSDHQLRSLDDFLRDWTPLGPAHRSALRNLQLMAADILNADTGVCGYELREFAADVHQEVCRAMASNEPPKNEADAPAAHAGEETGWVIEHGRSQPSRPEYWTGDGFDHDNLKAIRFAHKEDAERVANCLGGGFPEGYHRIADHMWCP